PQSCLLLRTGENTVCPRHRRLRPLELHQAEQFPASALGKTRPATITVQRLGEIVLVLQLATRVLAEAFSEPIPPSLACVGVPALDPQELVDAWLDSIREPVFELVELRRGERVATLRKRAGHVPVHLVRIAEGPPLDLRGGQHLLHLPRVRGTSR